MTKRHRSSYEMSTNGQPSLAQPAEEFAIDVHKVNLSYGWRGETVLDGLSLQLPRGNIYGLLGPSGCGKTSLIRCILGMVKIRAGQITVFGKEPGSSEAAIPGSGVGYMPQEISLYPDLTIRETLQYFASLYGLSSEHCSQRVNFLVDFLNLPDKGRFVGKLSGGQKRRVSLATALIHKPPLLILDEPTVGVDPLLRKSIWDHLTELSTKDNMTVLITTHYIEEAKDANLIGLMRGGQILEQGNPSRLLVHYQMDTLEQVFLHLCTTEETKKSHLNTLILANEAANEEEEVKISPSSSVSSGIDSIDVQKPAKLAQVKKVKVGSFSQIRTLVVKNSKTLIRSPGYLLFQFMLPMVEVFLFCLALGLDINHNPVSVYDGDNSSLSRSFLAGIDSKVIEQTVYGSEAKALAAVKDGTHATALLIYPKFMELLVKQKLQPGEHSADELRNSSIHLAPDMSNQMMVQFIEREVLRAFLESTKKLLENMNMSTSMVDVPVQLDTPVYGRNNTPFTEYMAPGVMLGLSFFSSISLTTMDLIIERKMGLMERTSVAGVSHFSILLSQVFTKLSVLFAQVGSLFVAVFVVFKIPYAGSLFWITVLTLLQSFAGLAMGLFISSVSDSENTATMLALGVFYPMMLLSGSLWPIEAMNDVLQYISFALPEAIPIKAMRALMVRGWDITNPHVYAGFLVTIAWIALLLLFATIISKFRN